MPVRGMTSEVAVVQHVSAGDAVFTGALAGLVGAVLFALVAGIGAIADGLDTLSPFRTIGATFVGPAALGGLLVVVYGLTLHLATSVTWGVFFAALLPRDVSWRVALVSGFLYGLLVMLVMAYVVLPWANPLLRQSAEGSAAFAISHLVYGGALALVPALRRRFFA